MPRALRPLLVAAAVGALAVGLSPAIGAAPTGAERLCPGGSDAVLKKGRWTIYNKPEELTRVLAHAEGSFGQLILATDGRRVARSVDAGCSWKVVYEVTTPTGEDTPLDGVLPRVSGLSILPDTTTALLVIDGVARAVASQVLRSDKGGAEGSWSEVEGLPPATGVREIVTAPDSHDFAYLITGTADPVGENDPSGSNGLVYRSEDDGATWTSLGVNGEVERLAVEPDTDGNYVWIARSNGTVATSQDAGSTFVPVPLPPNPEGGADHWRDIATYRFATVSHAVVVTASPTKEADVTRALVSLNKGATWQDLPVDQLGPAGGLIFGNAQSQLFSAGGSEATSWRGPGLVEYAVDDKRWKSVDEIQQMSLLDPRSVLTPHDTSPYYQAIFMRAHGGAREDPDAIVRYEPEPPPEGDPTLLGRPDCGDPNTKPVKHKAVRFEPERLDVKLQPGEPARVPVKAAIGPDPAPVDVAFLVDNSESMDPAIEGLFCSIERLVRELPERHLDARFGLASYNDISEFTYQRLVDILPPEEAGPAISAALKRLFTIIGRDEPLRSALYQLATGSGMDMMVKNPYAPGNVRRFVAPGQQMNYRPDGKSLRTVIVVTDEPWEINSEGEPEIAAVMGALSERNIRVIGLPVLSDAPPTDTQHSVVRQVLLRQQITDIARGTGALAPRGGVDCDGGGSPDVAEGQPIVCPINERGIKREFDDTLVSVLTSLVGPDLKPVRLVPRETSGLTATVEGEAPELNMRQPNDLEATTVMSCTEEQAGQKFKVSFDVVAGAQRVLDTIEGLVTCGEIPAAVVPPVPPRAPKAKPKPAAPKEPAPAPVVQTPPNPVPAPAPQIPQPGVAAAPPPAPPAPAPVQGAPATSSAPAQAAAAQPGVAMQEERRVQVTAATVSADGESSTPLGRDHAMVRSRPAAFRSRSSVPTETLWTLGVGVAGLLAYVGVAADPRRRRRQTPVPATVTARERARGA